MKYLPWIVFGFTVIGSLWGGGQVYGKIQAKAEVVKEKVAAVEAKATELEKQSIKLDKTFAEFSVEQKYIKGDVSEVKDTLKEILLEIKKKR